MKQPKAPRKQAKGATARHTRTKRGTGKSVSQHHPAGKQPAAHHPAHPAHPAHHGGGGGGGKAAKAPAAGHHAAQPHHRHAPAKTPKKRGLAPGAVACCAAEALAASLRGSGCLVEPWDVLDLYAHTADNPDAGASISETLEAAYVYGLAGVRPVSFGPVDLDDPAAVVLGLELPGPHALLATPDGWWSWGAHYCPCEFPDAVIEEAWRVEWPTTA